MNRNRPIFQVSNPIAQFNCLYRWHATTSKADQAWVDKLMATTWPGQEPDKVWSFITLGPPRAYVAHLSLDHPKAI